MIMTMQRFIDYYKIEDYVNKQEHNIRRQVNNASDNSPERAQNLINFFKEVFNAKNCLQRPQDRNREFTLYLLNIAETKGKLTVIELSENYSDFIIKIDEVVENIDKAFIP